MSTEQCIAVTLEIDLGKTWFHVVGLDTAGSPVKRAKLNRAGITRFFVNLPRALIGMEACPGSQWLARKLQTLGHEMRIVPAQFVKPYVKSNKNYTIDAAAIAEAITRTSMRVVQIKHCDPGARSHFDTVLRESPVMRAISRSERLSRRCACPA